ncbi:UNVERIFIED_CONTAM: hypothetical protein RMT77_006208 [Armadillidium vulgare]|nr:Heme-binding protein 2 [Armadillidium vulgare]
MSNIIKGLKSLIGDVEMVPYTVIADHEIYEERLYPAGKWVCTSLESTERDSCSSSMFRMLFNFIAGKNKPNIRVDMTAPVSTLVESGSSPGVKKFTMGFFIPQEQQESPPESCDGTVFIECRPEMRILTRRFSGYATEEIIQKEVEDLTKILKESEGEEKVNFDTYYIVGYDPPYKPINRRNEIWFVKKESSNTDKKDSTPNDKEDEIAENSEDVTEK